MPIRLVVAFVFTLVVASLHASASEARTLELADLRHEVTFYDPAVLPDFGQPEFSPDGRTLAFVLSTPDFQTDTSVDRVVLLDVRTGAQRALLSHLYGARALRWAPTGERLALLGSLTPDEPPQLLVADPKTGTTITRTAAPHGVVDFAWRPDGNELLFSREDSAPQLQGTARFVGAFPVGDNDYLATAAPLAAHLWEIAPTDGPAHQLTRGEWMVPKQLPTLPQHFPRDFFSWSPDGSTVAFTRTMNAYTADDDHAVIALLDVATGRARKLTGHAGLESGGEFSPDGRHIAYWYPRNGVAIGGSDIYVTARQGGAGVDVTRRLDRSPWLALWMPDSASLLTVAHDGTHENMWIVRLDGTFRKLDTGDRSVSTAAVTRSGAIAFVASGPQTPSELFYLSAPAAKARTLTHVNGYFSSLRLGRVASLGWKGPDGFLEDGVLTYPPGFVAGKRYPLVLQIHGWPAYASQAAFDTDYPGLTQYLAASGYVVFEPNYRGSDNLGNAYEVALLGDTADGPGRDIMAGIAAVEKLGFVDADRIGVSGWSYGGFMTAWLISHYAVWKAAMVGAGPTDILADYAISDYNVLDRFYYGGSPWSSKAMLQRYLEQSIMPYAWKVNTPTLLLAATGDTTVPISHSYELFHALHDRGVPVRFIAYDSGEHFPSDPVKGEDIYRRWRGWFDHYLR